MAHEGYHEPVELLSEKTKDLHRGFISLIEELEAIDWYQQRADACSDSALRAILLHNLNEEVEHASMTLEWIRRQHPEFDKQLRAVLFREGDVVETESKSGDGGHDDASTTTSASLGVGSLKGPK